jgi:hypothetical protein
MAFQSLQRLATHLKHMRPAASAERAVREFVKIDYDPTWNGVGHWQNLLSSPMDARNYVLQDWEKSFDRPSPFEMDDQPTVSHA